MRGMAPRLSLGTPWRYLPVSRPEASGLQVLSPSPMSWKRWRYSASTRFLWKRLYSGCSTTGLARWWRSAICQAAMISEALHSEVPQ